MSALSTWNTTTPQNKHKRSSWMSEHKRLWWMSVVLVLAMALGSIGVISGLRYIASREPTNKAQDISGTQASGNSYSGGCSISSISSPRRFVAFPSEVTNLVPGDTNGKRDVFVRDRKTGTIRRVSISSSGAQANDHSYSSSISAHSKSADGRFVVFSSFATNLVPNDTNNAEDVFVRDLQSGTTRRVSVSKSGAQAKVSSSGAQQAIDAYGYPPSGDSTSPSISADGRFVVFTSTATNLVPGHTGGTFVRELRTGTTKWVSGGGSPSICADGRLIAFSEGAAEGIFVRDLQTGATERISVNSAGAQAEDGYYGSRNPRISANGRFVAFESFASNLVPGDTNNDSSAEAGIDVFVRDRKTGTTERVNVSSSGAQADGVSLLSNMSEDGRFVTFTSDDEYLAPGARLSAFGSFYYVHDRQTGTTKPMRAPTPWQRSHGILEELGRF